MEIGEPNMQRQSENGWTSPVRKAAPVTDFVAPISAIARRGAPNHQAAAVGLALLILAGLIPLSANADSKPAGYYFGWAEVELIDGGIRVSFEPIDCNVASFALVLPQDDGALVAHFDVPLLVSADDADEAGPEQITARKAQIIVHGSVRESPHPPALLLTNNGQVSSIKIPSSPPIFAVDLMLLTAGSADQLLTGGLFQVVEVASTRELEADPFILRYPLRNLSTSYIWRMSSSITPNR